MGEAGNRTREQTLEVEECMVAAEEVAGELTRALEVEVAAEEEVAVGEDLAREPLFLCSWVRRVGRVTLCILGRSFGRSWVAV